MEKVGIKIDDALSNQLINSAVGFLKFRDNGQEADVAGSGTFIQLGKIKGILTAGHRQVGSAMIRSRSHGRAAAGWIGLLRFFSPRPKKATSRARWREADCAIVHLSALSRRTRRSRDRRPKKSAGGIAAGGSGTPLLMTSSVGVPGNVATRRVTLS
jgi:hypothetical protein